MKTTFLFPHHFKKIGWLLFVPGILIVIALSFTDTAADEYLQTNVFALYSDGFLDESAWFKIIKNSISDEILTFAVIIGGILVGFSKVKSEDEMISKMRYESLVWATYLNYGLILFFTLFVYGIAYMNVLLHNLFTLLLFFIIRFHYMIYKINKTTQDEE